MMKKVWSIILFFAGLAFFTGMIDALAKMWVKLQLGIDISEYFTPHFDRFVALEPILGANDVARGNPVGVGAIAAFAFDLEHAGDLGEQLRDVLVQG